MVINSSQAAASSGTSVKSLAVSSGRFGPTQVHESWDTFLLRLHICLGIEMGFNPSIISFSAKQNALIFERYLKAG